MSLDLSVRIHGHTAGNPLGPAPGPLTATAAGIYECWQHGARVFEIRADHLAAAADGKQLIDQAGGRDFVFDLNLSADVSPVLVAHRQLVHCATVYCFHEGPADRIAKAARFLRDELGLPVSLKFSPSLLGGDDLNYLLHERLGLTQFDISPHTFEREISFDEAIALVRRLPGVAVKFSNVLEIVDRTTGETLYLTGAPLYVIALRLVERWRQNYGLDCPVGFSAGVDAHNFADCVTCGLAPVTACTDLLKPGGSARFRQYLLNLEARMQQLGVTTIADLIRRAEGNTAASPEYAALLNTGPIWARAVADPRYDFSRRPLSRTRIGSHLWLTGSE